MADTDTPALAIGLRIVSGLLFTGMLVCVKVVSLNVPLGERVLPVFLRADPVLVGPREFPRGLATKRPWDHFLRASFRALAMFASFAAIARLNVAEAILISQLSAVLLSIAAVVWLSEPIRKPGSAVED